MIRRVWRAFATFVTILVLGLIAIELVARYGLGLGDPPLSQNHPTIEYMLQPGRTYHRFGNEYRVNAYSMRSDPFPDQKSHPDERRVMVFGDSIVNGGNITDQSELATELLRHRLRQKTGGPVVIGNISSGSWGPQNQLAYLRQFGLFDADLAVLVFGAADLEDVPKHELTAGFSASHPASTPPTALHEAWTRYLPRYVPWLEGDRPPSPSMKTIINQQPEYKHATVAMLRLCEEITAQGVPLILALHPTRDAFEAGRHETAFEVIDAAALPGVDFVDLLPRYRASTTDASMYRDALHLRAAGQRILAEALQPEIEKRLGLASEDAPPQR